MESVQAQYITVRSVGRGLCIFRSVTNDIDAIDFIEMFLDDENQVGVMFGLNAQPTLNDIASKLR